MARDRKPEPTATAVVASAGRVDSGVVDYLKFSRTASGWQSEAWYFYDTVGEFRYACDWVGSMLAKATLHAATEHQDGPKRIESGPPAQVVSELYGGPEGQAEMLRQIGIHFTVAGECYLLGWAEDGRDHWMIAAATAVSSRKVGESRRVWYVNSIQVGSDSAKVMAIRLWKPHPQRPMEANSPTRAVLGILAEIAGLSQHIQTQVNSRLAGAGIALFPSEMTLPARPPGPNGEQPPVAPNTASEMMLLLQQAMAASIKDPSSTSRHVPIVVTAPGDQIDNVRHVTFWTELDEKALELRSDAIRRLSLGLDMPPEMLTGVGQDNHWTAWLADESGIKAHTEPLLRVVTGALSDGFLRPALEKDDALGMDPQGLSLISIRADTSQMRLRPNRSKEALELFDRAELSGAALRRETGFGPEDAMDPAAMKAWYVRKVAMGQTTPEIVEAALRAVGVDLDLGSVPERDHEARPTPSLIDHPERNPPELDAALVAAADQIVRRALERAGNRIRNRTSVKVGGVSAMNTYMAVSVRAGDMDFLLDDAWTSVPEVARRHEVSADWLTSALDSYCRLRMHDQQRHDYDSLHTYLANLFEVLSPEVWRVA